MIPVIDSSSYDRMTAEVLTLRQARPETSALALAVDLTLRQLRGLLSNAIQDFSVAPLNADDFLTRLERTAGLASSCQVPAGGSMPLSLHAHDLVGTSPSFARVLSMLPRIAGCDASVLILGETGTGKEVCARAIHYTSARASKPWVAVNCGALPPDLIEAELFGHVRGAFTTAHTAHKGLIAEAEGGSLLLDEIDSMPVSAQSKLLRFLQEKQYRPIGASKTLVADVRVIAASNSDLRQLVALGRFRQDLYFRLNVLNLTLPALQERREDIAALSLHFLQQFSRRDKRPLLGLGPAALQRLLAYPWPGNVRELKHVLERAALTVDGPVIQAQEIDLPQSPADTERSGESFREAKGRVVGHFERDYIRRLLTESGGNVSRAARMAQKNRRAFFQLMRKHNIRPNQLGGA